MIHEVLHPIPDRDVTLTTYIFDRSDVLWNLKYEWQPAKRPAVLICPGGAYSFVSDREGEPVALSFMQNGFNAFVLRYSVGDASAYPGPLEEISAAVWMIRSHAEEWYIDPDQIAICGFSAGGHLCTLLGTQWHTPGLCERLSIPEEGNKPNAMVLCYTTTGEETARNLENGKQEAFEPAGPFGIGAMLNPQTLVPQAVTVNYIDEKTPPAYIWQAREDFLDVKESMHFAEKMYEIGVPFELHIFGNGGHGMGLSSPLTNYYMDKFPANLKEWFPLCVGWLKALFHYR